MNKFTLVLNSHTLSNFQSCPCKYQLHDILSLRTLKTKKAFDKGTLTSRVLQNYYYRKFHKKNELIPLSPFMLTSVAQKRLGVELQEAREFSVAMWKYHKKYEQEDWKVLAIEKGFSKILYEDDQNIFVIEGRPDLVVQPQIVKAAVVDHKTQSREYSIYPFDNQPLTYCFGTDLRTFIYNYIKFTKEPEFRREVITFSDSQIEQWKQDTIIWAFRIKEALLSQVFPRSWQCSDKFGVCDYNKICEQPNINVKLQQIKNFYKKVPPRRSW